MSWWTRTAGERRCWSRHLENADEGIVNRLQYAI
jgi:hypothetical protein